MKAKKLLSLKFLLGFCFLTGFLLLGNISNAQNPTWTVTPSEGCVDVTTWYVTVDLTPVGKTCSDILDWSYRIVPVPNSYTSVGNAGSCTFSMVAPYGGTINWRVKVSAVQYYVSTYAYPVDYHTNPGYVSGGTTVCTGINSGDLVVHPVYGEPIDWEWSSDGNPPWTSLSNADYVQSYLNLTSTTWYRCIVKNYTCDAQVTSPVAILVEATPSTSIPVTDVSCNGGTDGAITFSQPSVGTPPYYYTLIPGSTVGPLGTGYAFTGLAAGTYTAYFTDYWGCESQHAVKTVNQPTAITSETSHTNVSCHSGADGTITISASGGSGFYRYSDDGGSNFYASNLFTGLAPGTYSIWVMDQNHTTCLHQEPDVVITEPPQGVTSSTIKTNISCHGLSDGVLDISASGGYGTYAYSDDNGSTWHGGPGATYSFTGLPLGTYHVWVHDAAHTTCPEDQGEFTITQPPELASQTVKTDVTCNGLGDGTIMVSASGGYGFYDYSKDGGSTWQTSNVFTGLTPGTYTVWVRDQQHTACTHSEGEVVITQQPELESQTSHTDITCYGANDGTITVNASGGYGTYDYSKNGGGAWQSSNVFVGLTPGTYTVWVRDRDHTNCTHSEGEVSITEPGSLYSNTTPTNVTCNNAGDGIIHVFALYGSGFYDYSKDGGSTWQTSNDFTGLTPGTYTVWVRDQLHTNCTHSEGDVVITQPDPLTSNTVKTDVTCNNAGDGTITVSASGGYGFYDYSKDGGSTWQTSNVFSGLAPGTYTVWVRDQEHTLCTHSEGGVVITQPDSLASNTDHTNVTCHGLADGTIHVYASGGYGNYEYSLDGGSTWQTSSVFTGLGPGVYIAIVRDADHTACTHSEPEVQIYEPDPLTSNTSSTDVSCYGGSDGTITVNAYGGWGVYDYSDDGGSTWVDPAPVHYYIFTGLTAGTYHIMIRDKDHTMCTEDQGNVIVHQPTETLASTTDHADVNCFNGQDGTITVSASGGWGTYEYSDNGGSTWQTSNFFGGLIAGTYNVKIRDAQHTICTEDQGIVIIEQPGDSLYSATTPTNVSCYGGSDGTITVNASGGWGTYEYSDDGGSTWQTSNVFTGLFAGGYDVWIRDKAHTDCMEYQGYIIIYEPGDELSSDTYGYDVSCYGGADGSISVDADGGWGNYEYSNDNGSTWQTSNEFDGLTAGTYHVWVRDADHTICMEDQDTVVIHNPPADLESTSIPSFIVCYGGSGGSITVNASGGWGLYEYSDDGGSTWQGSNIFSGLLAGTYHMVVRDADHPLCTEDQGNIVVVQPDPVGGDLVIDKQVTCEGLSDGQVTVTGTGGTPPYSYNLNGGSWQTNGLFTSLGVGFYTVTIKDDNDCLGYVTFEMTQSYFGPKAKFGDTPPLCTNTQICIPVIGFDMQTGVAEVCAISLKFTFDPNVMTFDHVIWNDGTGPGQVPWTDHVGYGYNSLHVTVDPTNPGVIRIGGHGQSFGFPAPGSGTLATICFNYVSGNTALTWVDDGNNKTESEFAWYDPLHGCIPYCDLPNSHYYFPSEVNGPEFPLGIAGGSATHTDVSCNAGSDGTVTVAGSGGTSPYTYTLNPGSYTGGPVAGAFTFTGLTAGTYTYTITDASSCPPVTGTQTVLEPPALGSTTNHTDVDCNSGSNGTITVTATGGWGTYEYSDNGGSTWQSSNIFNGLIAGTYDVVIRDAQHTMCTEDQGNVIIPEPTTLGSTSVPTIVSCFGGNDGAITVTATGGWGNYEYSKDGGSTWQTSNVFNGLSAGTYHVVIRDADHTMCTEDQGYIVVEQPTSALASQTGHTDVNCYGGSDGTIIVTASGGWGTYEYSDDGGSTWQTSNVFTELIAGTYHIVIRDAAHTMCMEDQGEVIILQSGTELESTTDHTDVNCYGGSDGTITVSASGGWGTYEYSDDGGSSWQTSNVFNGLIAGTYNVKIRDAVHPMCMEDQGNVIILQPTDSLTSITSHTDVNCFNGQDGTITVNASGGWGTFEYSIDGGSNWQTSNVFNGLSAGTYHVVIRDAAHTMCTEDQGNVIVLQPTDELASITDHTDVNCYGGNDGTIHVYASGGWGTYEYSDDGGSTWQTSSVFTGLIAGTYHVIIRDKDHTMCTEDQQFVVISQPTAGLGSTTDHTDVNCYSGSDGTITVNASGGWGTYEYSDDGGSTWQTSNVFTGLIAGTYHVVIRDAAHTMCMEDQGNVIILQPTEALASTTDHTDVNCFNGQDGTITVSASGGWGTFEYSIDGGSNWQTSNVFNGLSAGTYHVVIRDAAHTMCTEDQGNVIVLQPTAELASTTDHTDVNCFGGNDGTIHVYASGGWGTYEYSDDGGSTWQTSSVFTGLIAGTYHVKIRDAAHTMCMEDQGDVIIHQPTAELASTTDHTDVNCYGGSDGTITVSASGGWGTYEYSDDGGSTWQTSNIFTGLIAGTYHVMIRDKDHTMCMEDQGNVIILQPTEALASTTDHTDVNCFDGQDGTITVSASGGWGTYEYSDDGGSTWQTSNVFNGLSAGTYHVVIRDAAHTMCTEDQGNVVIHQPTGPLGSQTNHTDVNCYNGSDGTITVTASGGWGHYDYSDDGGSTWVDPFPVNYYIFTGLTAGTYHVMIRDKDHTMCTEDQGYVYVLQPQGPLGSTTDHTDVGCHGGSDGSITVTASGGWGTYEYSDDGGSTWQTSNVFDGLVIGTYHVIVRDAAHTMCFEDQGDVIITQPELLQASASNNGPICEGQNAQLVVCVSATGGTAPFSYHWMDPGLETFDISDPTTCLTVTANYALHNGVWHVTVTDAHGCTITATTTVVIKQRFDLDGYMHYNNDAHQVMVGVVIGLYLGNTEVATSTTDANGYYHFDYICCDAYTLQVDYNPYIVGSINSTDACQVQWWWTHCGTLVIPIQLVNFFAGDVAWGPDQDWINSTDAEWIQQYFVYGGPPSFVFDRAPWSYAIEGLFMNCNPLAPPPPPDDITVNLCSNQSIDLLAQVTGDFNRSYIVGFKDASAKVQLTYGQTKQVSPNKEFDLSVYVVNPYKVSATSLVLNFPANLVEVMNVTMDGGLLDWNVNGNELRIGWHTMNPLSLDAHATLVTLHLRTTGDFKVGSSIRLSLVSNPMNELADQLAIPIPNAILGVDIIEASPIGIPENSSVSDLTLENHPNPFSNETMFDYSLPFDGKVTLVIHNLLGETVKTLINEPQTQGDHTFRFDASSVATGVYTATIKLDANGTILVRTIKLIRTK